MSLDNQLLADLIDGQLSEAQEKELAALLQADPQLQNLVMQDLQINDLLARELNPSRTDAGFLDTLFIRLDIDPSGGPDGDGADSSGSDGDGADGQGLDGLDPASGPDVGLLDPGSAVGSAGASGGAATGGATAGGGILGWTFGGILAVVVGTTAVVINKSPKTPTPPPAPVVTELVASADVFVYGRWKKSDSKLPTLDVVQGQWWVSTRTSHLQFELSKLPKDFSSARLRLYCISTGTDIQPLGIWQTANALTVDAPDKSLDRREFDKVFTIWEPQADTYWEIDVTEAVKAEQAGDGIISFGIASMLDRKAVKDPEITSFASREHKVAKQRPTLIIETKQK